MAQDVNAYEKVVLTVVNEAKTTRIHASIRSGHYIPIADRKNWLSALRRIGDEHGRALTGFVTVHDNKGQLYTPYEDSYGLVEFTPRGKFLTEKGCNDE